MIEADIRPPLLLVGIGAALCTFWLAVRRPASLPSTMRARVGVALLEGMVVGGVWSGITAWTATGWTADLLWDGALIVVLWAVIAWWSKGRMWMPPAPSNHPPSDQHDR